MSHYVYLLFDPRNAYPFYVGMTKRPEMRLYQHISSCNKPLRNGFTLTQKYIQQIITDGFHPHMELIEEMPTESDARGREAFWIGMMVYYNIDITNPGNWWVRHSLDKFIEKYNQYEYKTIKEIDPKGYVTPKWVNDRQLEALHSEFRAKHSAPEFTPFIADVRSYIEYLEQRVMTYERSLELGYG